MIPLDYFMIIVNKSANRIKSFKNFSLALAFSLLSCALCHKAKALALVLPLALYILHTTLLSQFFSNHEIIQGTYYMKRVVRSMN